MGKTWCKKQSKSCDYLDSVKRCNFETISGGSYLDCEHLIEEKTLEFSISGHVFSGDEELTPEKFNEEFVRFIINRGWCFKLNDKLI